MKIKELLDLDCSFFDNTFTKPTDLVKVRCMFTDELKPFRLRNELESGELDKRLANMVKKSGKTTEYQKLKEQQCAITPSGIFGERRSYEYLQEVNPLMVIDIDKPVKLEQFKKYSWVIGAGESASRQGAWVLVYIAEPSLFKEHFEALRKIFKDADNLKDATRLRYLSYGKSWHRPLNETIEPFTEKVPLPSDDIYDVSQMPPTTKYDNEKNLQPIIMNVGSIEEAGGLHPWAVRVAARCNKKGISLQYCIDQSWDTIKSEKVIKETSRYTKERFSKEVKSVYELYKHEHHISLKVRISRSRVDRFGPKLYSKSPKILQELTALAKQSEEKEVVYFTAIILLGTLFPNRCFKYFNNLYYPTLYGYILGEAASFKGKAKLLRQALKPYQQKIDEVYKESADKRLADIAYNKANKENQRPVTKLADLNLFFDGNTSSAAMLKAMQDSPLLVMFETEGDTITKTWKTDWGNYSDILRKTFEHEPLYSLKKNGQEDNLMRIRIDKPKLSVLVSSTEQQMRKVLSADETENGLMSRFLFYIVQNDKKWYNGWESNSSEDIGAILTERISPDIWFNWCNQSEVYYHLSKEALMYHQDYFNHVNDSWPDDLFSIIALVRRAGTACVRIAMTLEELKLLDKPKSAIKVHENSISGETMLLAIDIMKVLLQHLFVSWQITYKEQDFKETNVQTSETRQQVSDLLSSNPTWGYKKVAKELDITRDLARHHVTEVRKSVELNFNERKSKGRGGQ
jgi:hypothetical protein